MIKLLKNLKKIDYFLIFLILGLTFAQVWSTMELMDYISGITRAIQEVVITKSTHDIWYNGLMMIVMALLMVLCQAIISIISSYVTSRLAMNIRMKVNDKVQSFSLAEINSFSTASLITRTTNDIQTYQMTLLLAFRMFFAAPITVVWAILKIQSVSWTLMLPALIGIFLLVILILSIVLLVMPKNKLSQRLLDKINGITRENVTGIRVVHAYNAESYQEDKFNKVNEELRKTQSFIGKGMALMMPSITIIMNLVSLLVYWIGASLINKGDTNYAEVLSMMMLSTQLVMSFMMLLFMFYMVPRASVSAKRINEVLDKEISIKDPEVEEERKTTGEIEFKNVSFKYPNSESNIISNISFKVCKGETIAFIGETGCGKSTIINLLSRLYDTTEGEVLIDGVNIKNLKLETINELIGVVPQKALLFSGSVKYNVAFGKKEIDENKVLEACKIAEADSFVSAMHDGYNSNIAQGGTNVSGGQRQRLCIARALYADHEFLVFDDSFSALDFKTDRKVRDNLKEFRKDSTKLIVAQRIGTIMDADHIVVLEEGKIKGVGKHEDLLKNCKEYLDIALSQLSKEELGL